MNNLFEGETKIKQNERFYTAKVLVEGRPYFYKKSQSEEFNHQIEKQFTNARFLAQKLSELNIDWLKTEQVITSGEDWILIEWIDGQEIATSTDFKNRKNLESLELLAKVQAVLDEIAQKSIDSKPVRIGGQTMLIEAREKQSQKLESLIEKLNWDAKLIESATDYWVEGAKNFKSCIQHADLTPWHLYLDRNDKLILIDTEHVSDDWPRFYDVGNCYSMLTTRFNLIEQAESTLIKFSELSGIDIKQQPDFWSVVMIRNLLRLVEHSDGLEQVERTFSQVKQILDR